MNIFIFEYFAGGGGDQNSSMLTEGRAMLNCALADFGAIDGVTPFFTSDFEAGVATCDAALIIAPETDGILHRLTKFACDKGKKNLGCSPSAIGRTGDKLLFAKHMEGAKIAHPKTCLIDDSFDPTKEFGGVWISKPIDGAGSEGICVWSDCTSFNYKSMGGKMIAQEYIEGDHMSMSIISSESESIILSVNKQKLSKGLKYMGGEITGAEPDDDLQMVVEKIKGVIPGLNGYWGVDYVAIGSGHVVIEVNPRLTTSYSALSQALDINLAEMIVAASCDVQV